MPYVRYNSYVGTLASFDGLTIIEVARKKTCERAGRPATIKDCLVFVTSPKARTMYGAEFYYITKVNGGGERVYFNVVGGSPELRYSLALRTWLARNIVKNTFRYCDTDSLTTRAALKEFRKNADS